MGTQDHGHTHGGHVEPGDHTAVRLIGAATVNVGFGVVQVVVGVALGSVVVLADAAHQVVDAVGIVTALVAVMLIRRPPSDSMSFGWGKADALGGLVSGALLFASVGWIVWESVQRLRAPVEVSGSGVIVIGLVAIAVNGGSVLLLGAHGENLSLRAARLHLLTDLAGSLIVVLTGIVLAGGGWNGFDAVASLVLSAMVVYSTWRLIRAAIDELLDRSPSPVTPETIRAALDDVGGVLSVHHVHARPLGGGKVSVTAHVVVDGEQSLHEAQEHIGAVSARLADRLGVAHTTLQLECHDCADPEHQGR
jgi:cobalt-zinc-cadmium efflux system protein